ncbi:MAG: dTDP-4-dehydrorhamnose reductase [Bacteroidales bacterium]|jgi:dTDP-4-dehydrorhamnose reductase|nr:dTDP-4-dehydrorhamnose reductase [Bacteroidales bacterium]
MMEKTKNILVTGSNGQLGLSLKKVLGRNIEEGKRKNNDNFLFTDVNELDITDKDSVVDFMAEHEIDVVVNCAAYTNVEKAEENEERADLLNNVAVGYLASACKDAGAFLIHISTDYVFGGKANTPYTEDMEPGGGSDAPCGVYGRTKLAGEKIITASDCKYLIFRTAWLYSDYGKNFVKTISNKIKENTTSGDNGMPGSIKVVFDQVGTPTFAEDLADAILTVIDKRMLDRQGVYNFTDEGVCSWYDFAVEIGLLTGFGSTIGLIGKKKVCRIIPCRSDEFHSKVERPSYSVLDKTRVKDMFGIEIPYWRESLKKCISDLAEADVIMTAYNK